ncbi:hypothetical protein CEQ90_12335 [Lewinellaceae bacterium SD302]|nr:hypothetical protein CEQ90_12335 [Lewinellaceae bacterium SD302]
MNKRISLLCTLLFVTVLSLSAQAEFAFGLKAGLTTSALEGHELELNGGGLDELTAKLTEANYGFQGGIFMRVPVGERLFLQPEATFNTSTATFTFQNDDQGIDQVFKERYNNLDVPLLLGYDLGFLKFQGGPVGHFFFNEGKDVFTSEGWSSAVDEFNIGYALGGSLDIGKLTFDVRYAGNFSKFGQTFDIAGEEFAVDQAAKRWVFTVGYRL